MPSKLSTPRYLLRWDHSRAIEVGRDVVVTPHRLCELPLTSTPRLVQTLERHPVGEMSVFSMGTNPAYPNQWQTGEFSESTRRQLLDGSALLNIIEQGRLVVVLHNVDQHHSGYGQTAQRLYRELIECHVGLRIDDITSDLVLASPQTIQYYRCDHRPTVRWQLRGKQTVLTYPANANFIDPQAIQDLIVDQCGRSLYFQPEFDDHATSFELNAGEMLTLPHPMPYRVESGGGLNVWLQTQHDTHASSRRRNIYVANRALRKMLPESLCAPTLRGTWPSIKSLLTRVCGLADRYSNPDAANNPTFVVQPSNESYRIGSNQSDSDTKRFTTPIPGLDIEPITTTSVVSEN